MASAMADSPFKIVRDQLQKFLNEMRVLRVSAQEQVKAKAEEIKSQSLAPGKSQYSVSEVDAIIKNFKSSYSQVLNDVHLMIVTEGTTKIRTAIEQGFVKGEFITEEMLDQLQRYKKESERIPSLEKERDELNSKVKQLNKENALLQKELAEAQAYIQNIEGKISELAETAAIPKIDETLIKERDEVIRDKDREIQKLTLEKTNLQSEFNRIKIERDSYAKQIEELESKLRVIRSESASKEDQFFEELQKQLEKARLTIFNLRNQIAENEDTIRNQKIDISQKANQIEALKIDLDHSKEEINKLKEENTHLKNELKLIQEKMKEQESDTSKISELGELEKELKQQIEEKDKIIVEQQSKIETLENQVTELQVQLKEKDSDIERLAETMIELQQEISGKERELHAVQTQIDEFMLQIAEKDAESRELQERANNLSEEKEKIQKELEAQQEKIKELTSKLEETEKELINTKVTLDKIEKQGTISSEEKYQYELDIQKLRKKIDTLSTSLKSLEGFLNTDPKYRILYILNDFSRALTIEELSKILSMRKEILMKYIYELDYFGYIKKAMDKGTISIESTAVLSPPLVQEEKKEE